MLNDNGEIVEDPQSVLKEWRKYFSSLLNPNNDNGTIDMETPPRLENLNLDASELNADITIDEVRAAVLASGDHKSPGSDNIRPCL